MQRRLEVGVVEGGPAQVDLVRVEAARLHHEPDVVGLLRVRGVVVVAVVRGRLAEAHGRVQHAVPEPAPPLVRPLEYGPPLSVHFLAAVLAVHALVRRGGGGDGLLLRGAPA